MTGREVLAGAVTGMERNTSSLSAARVGSVPLTSR